MAKRIVAYDDLFLGRGEEVVAEHQSVPLALGDRRVELDLTDEHFKELEELLRPFLEAGAAPPPAVKPPPPALDPKARKGTGRQQTAYNRGMVAYAKARGMNYRSPDGKLYYSAKLRAEYAAYLRDGGEVLG